MQKASFALAGCAVALGVGLALEFAVLRVAGAVNNRADVSQITRGARPMPAAFPSNSAVDSWAVAALARPLFRPSRSPIKVPAQALIAPRPLPRLAGILLGPHEKIGIFSGSGGGSIIVGEGARLGAFKVLSIAANGVRLSGPIGIELLQVHYDDTDVIRATPFSAVLKARPATDFPGTNSWPSQFKITKQ